MSENQHNETPTPRTDAQLARVSTLEWRDPPPQVNADFARELERECAELRENWRSSESQWVARERQWADDTVRLGKELDAALARERRLREAADVAVEALGIAVGLPIARGYPDGPCMSREDHKECQEALAALKAAMAFDGKEGA